MKSFKEYIIEESDHESDFSSLKNKLDSMGIEHSISHNANKNTIHISKLAIKKEDRGQGKGSLVMKHITDHADKHGKRITLTPSKDFGASSVSRLQKFYKNHGFKDNKGKNKDFTTSETMYRDAQK